MQISERAQLEESLVRYANLENVYHKLLSQVELLQSTHLSDLRNTEVRYNIASTAMQKALVSKSEELLQITNKYVSLQAKYERDSRNTSQENQSLRERLDSLGGDFSDLELKFKERDVNFARVNDERTELFERVAIREKDLTKFAKALRVKEAELKAEVSARIQFEQSSVHNNDRVVSLNKELNHTKEQLEKKVLETSDYNLLQKSSIDNQKDILDMQRREKNYLLEIEQLSSRECKMIAEVEVLKTSHRQHLSETSRLTVKLAGATQENEILKVKENNFRNEIHQRSLKIDALSKESHEIHGVLQSNQNETNRYIRDIADLQSALHESRNSHQILHDEKEKLLNQNSAIMLDKNSLTGKIADLALQLESRSLQIDHQKKMFSDLESKLEDEVESKLNLRNQNKDRLNGVTLKITDLHESLAKTRIEMEELQKNESQYRKTIRENEETIEIQRAQFMDVCNQLKMAQDKLHQVQNEVDSLKAKKREELLFVHEKFSGAKANMEEEVASLREQLAKKSAQLQSVADESARLKSGLNEFSADRFSLEARCSELLASEASYQRQVSNLQQNLNQKSLEINRFTSRHQSNEEQLKRLEEELKVYRSGGDHDIDISRLQNNMEQLSKRLKNQVDNILERDDEVGKFKPTLKYSSKSRTPSANAPIPRVGNTKHSKVLDDFDEIDKLLAKSPAEFRITSRGEK